jgi:hypothetical protein
VIVEVPEGVITGGGGVTLALPPPQPVRAKVMQKIAATRTRRKPGGSWVWGFGKRGIHPAIERQCAPMLVEKCKEEESRASKIGAVTGTRKGGGKRSGIDGGSSAGPLVVTVTLKGAGFPFVTETLEGA